MTKRWTVAELVEEGDFLPDLDNGYVFEVELDPGPDYRNDYNVSLFRGMVAIWFHDADGDENCLILQPNHPITVGKMEG